MSRKKDRARPVLSASEEGSVRRKLTHEQAMEKLAVTERNPAMRGAGRARTPEERQLHSKTARIKIQQRAKSQAAIKRMKTLLPPEVSMPSKIDQAYYNRNVLAKIKPRKAGTTATPDDLKARRMNAPDRRTATPTQYVAGKERRVSNRRGAGRKGGKLSQYIRGAQVVGKIRKYFRSK